MYGLLQGSGYIPGIGAVQSMSAQGNGGLQSAHAGVLEQTRGARLGALLFAVPSVLRRPAFI